MMRNSARALTPGLLHLVSMHHTTVVNTVIVTIFKQLSFIVSLNTKRKVGGPESDADSIEMQPHGFAVCMYDGK